MTRYGTQYGPDTTFLGVPACDWREPDTYAGAHVVVLGAPFDGGTSHRPGTRFGPQAIRQACYLPHDGSRPSLALLAADAGLQIEAVEHDSYAFQFWGSEQYRRDIPLTSEQSYRWGAGAPLFTAEQIAGWAAESERLNNEGRGDQAAVYLKRA